MATEIELKFLLSENEAPLISSLITQFSKTVKNNPLKTLVNSYFDTPNRDLRAFDIGFRTRSCDSQCEQTVKLAGKGVGGLHQRPEYNLPVKANQPNILDFPETIWPKELNIVQVAENLYPIFTTHFTRRTWLLETKTGSKIEVALDKGEVSAKGVTSSINELEIELLEGSQDELFSLAEHLLSSLGARLGLYSKAARGYRLADDLPLEANKSIGFVSLNTRDTQEQALESCLKYALEFVQKHEQCYFEKPSLKTLKRVMDGLTLLTHSFNLFKEIVGKATIDFFEGELQWLLSELAWVETAIYLKTYTSKRHVYYKKINNAPELGDIIAELKSVHPSVKDIHALFYSSRYNQLLLSLTRFLVDKQWRAHWGNDIASAANLPVLDFANHLFDHNWVAFNNDFPQYSTLTQGDYLKLKNRLESTLLSGNCLGKLFPKQQRQDFRRPWIDILYGIYELDTLLYLKTLCEGHNTKQLNKIQHWLDKKADLLVDTMEQSRSVSLNTLPYWR